jgi:ATP-dependent DNA helicase RecG
MIENQILDKKSLRVLTAKNPDWDELARDCVAFANAQGGKILFGIEDDASEPPADQKVAGSLVEQLQKNIQHRVINVATMPEKKIAENRGEYIQLTIQRCAQTIASTTDGQYYYREGDESHPLKPDELHRLLTDKSAFVWEVQTSKRVPRARVDSEKKEAFLKAIYSSDRVSNFVKEKAAEELPDYYFLATGENLTNLGILWIGKREDRATLLYSPIVQFIKYDEQENKVNKIVWDDYSKNPQELIDAVLNDIPDWKESYEIPDGMFRKNIPQYDKDVIRELIANALVHRPYTTRGDVFINLFHDRVEIRNPGTLPLGVTPANILHKTVKRNEHLAKVFYDLHLMEREGSGYDMIYSTLLSQGRELPSVMEDSDSVTVVVKKRIVKKEIIDFIEKVNQTFHLKQREMISLGLIAQHASLTALEFSRLLDLKEDSTVQAWLGRLKEFDLIRSRGKTRATEYFTTPGILNQLSFKGRTTLKKIEPHRLQELIRSDLQTYSGSTKADLHQRVGKEITEYKLRQALDHLIENGVVLCKGATKAARYYLAEKG